MALPETQQATNIINKASSLLLIVPEKPSSDAFASMTAAYVALLEHYQGSVEAVSPSHVPRQLQFLPGSSQVVMNPTLQPDIVVDIAGPTEITEIRPEPLRGGIRVHLKLPENMAVTRDAVEIYVRSLPYDAVIVFGATDLEELGQLFTNHADFFYSTPIINIDHRPGNEQFGTVNLVDITASSVAEVTHELISSLPNATIEPNIATCLYAGIVAATDSFQSPSAKPKAFQLAAELMNKKADKESVITNLVKTKPLHLLKLTGRMYARLRHDEYGGLFWSVLLPRDFEEAHAEPEHIADAMHELTNNISGYNVAFLLYEDQPQHYMVYMILGNGLVKRRSEIQEQLVAQRENGALTFSISAENHTKAEEVALEKIRGILV